MDEIEITEDNIIKMPDLDYEPSPYGIGYELFCNMKKYKLSVAQIDSETEDEDTFERLLERCIRTAIHLKTRGVTSDDIICICSYNQLNACVPYIAGLFIGAKICALDPSISFNDSKHLLSQVNPKIIFVVVEKESVYRELLQDMSLEAELVVFSDNEDEDHSFRHFLEESLEEQYFEPEKIENIYDTALILFSSGTTGLPKGICLSHFAVLAQAKNFELFGYNTYRALSFSTLYWISSVFMLVQSILSGTARLLCKTFDPLDVWYNIEKFEVTMMLVAPGLAIQMLKTGRPNDVNTTTLQDFVIGGGAISCENLLSLRDLLPGTNVFQAYGQTELAGSGTSFRTALRKDVLLLHDKPKSCGRPVPGIWYKIVDLETEGTLGYNQVGELRVKTQYNFNCYYNMVSTDAWDSEGWLKTGDVFYYDEDFCFYIVDRIKELLKYQSWHIPPALIEGILLQHYAVKNAVVIGVPHAEDGEHPLGVVVLLNDIDNVTEEILLEYVNARVDDRQKLRGGIVFTDDIPYTPTGKIRRRLLRDAILDEINK